jgi:tetratricopeptide (TPR) repeat protein
MPETTSPYRPVYHFHDQHLFELFIAKIPHSQLIDPLRNTESLRNRYFRGFRFSNISPTSQQILNAYSKEIIDRSNGTLASFLCTQWIGQHPEIASVALKFLEIQTEDVSDPNLWINDVHAKTEKTQHPDTMRALVQTLSQQFPADDVLIFVSLIGYGADQQELRHMVDHELSQVANDPRLNKHRLTRELHAAETSVKEFEQSRNELDSQQESEISKAQAILDSMLQELNEFIAHLEHDETTIQTLTKQIADLKAELAVRQQAHDATKTKRERLLKIIERQRKEMVSTQLTYDKRHKQIEGGIREEYNRITTLTTRLQQINDQILAQESKPSPSPTPVASPPSPSPEPSRKIHDLVGNNAICYQGLQRTFRNTVVAFLRERLACLFPADHIQRMKKTFVDEDWEKAAQNAKLSRENYGTTTTIRDDYDLLGTNHFVGLFERFYDKLFTPEAGQPASVPKPVKLRLLGNFKTIKDGRDPLSHPVEEEIPFEEAHHLLISAKQILSWLGYDTQAAELSSLAEQLDAGEEETPSVLRRLPSEDSIYLDFVGRDALLKELASCFANPDGKRCLLAGDGGKGKSAAAYRFAQTLSRAPGRFHLIVWLSAKRRKFREGVSAPIDSPDFTTAEEAINRLLNEYGATTQDMEKPIAERKQLLFEFLIEFPAFIIADDIDTLLEDVDVVSLFTHEIPQTPSAVLLTSRRAIPGIRAYTVQGFDAVEAEQFIKSRIQLYELKATRFSPTIVAEIQRATDSSPLYMDDLMRLARIVDINDAIRMWAEKRGDEARKYALQRELEQLSSDGRKVLIAAAVADDLISFAELESVLEFSEDRLLTALQELQTLFLLPRLPVVEGEQRYQINLNTKKLVRLVEGQRDLYVRIESVSKALAGKLPNVGQSIVSPLIRQALLRLSAGQTAEAEAILLKAIEKYPGEPDLRGFLGYTYKRIGRNADARSQFEAAYKIKAKSPEMFLHWMKLEIAEKDWSKAINVADRALKVVPDTYKIVELKVSTLRQAGFALHVGLHREKAERMWADAVEEIKRRIKSPEELSEGKRQLNASMYYTMVVCLDMLNRLSERNHWLELWEKEHPDDPRVAYQKGVIISKRGGL